MRKLLSRYIGQFVIKEFVIKVLDCILFLVTKKRSSISAQVTMQMLLNALGSTELTMWTVLKD